jgi:Co/Zn/Cd efflux system component
MFIALLFLFLVTRRACAAARGTGAILMQLLPAEHVGAVLRCLKAARAHPGVGSICDERIWALDEHTLVGSLTCLMHPGAYPPEVLRHVQRAFDGCVEKEMFTVQLLNVNEDNFERSDRKLNYYSCE